MMQPRLVMHPKLPQLAEAGDPDTIPGARAEVKYDGHRMLAFVDADKVRMFARSAVDKTGKLPEVERVLSEKFPDGTILDGEVVMLDSKGGDWSKVQNVLGAGNRTSTHLTYVVFDLLQLQGEDVRLASLATRRLLLETLFDAIMEDDSAVQLAPQEAYTPEFVADLIARGFEGAIVKDPAAPYASGKRGHGWLKIKATETVDVVVMGATEGKGRFAGQIGALVFGTYEQVWDKDHVVLVERGQCSGMDDSQRLAFTHARDVGTLVGTVIEVQHMGIMPSGGWRHPQFKRVRTDKLPRECVA